MKQQTHWTTEETTKLVEEHIRLFPGQLPRAKTIHLSQMVLPEERRRRYFTTMANEPLARQIAEKQGLTFPRKAASYYSRLTPEQKKARTQRQLEYRRGKRGKRVPKGCPYCDYTSKARGGVTRHIKREHPGETGLVTLPLQHGPNNNHAPSLTDKILELVADRIAASILKGLS